MKIKAYSDLEKTKTNILYRVWYKIAYRFGWLCWSEKDIQQMKEESINLKSKWSRK